MQPSITVSEFVKFFERSVSFSPLAQFLRTNRGNQGLQRCIFQRCEIMDGEARQYPVTGGIALPSPVPANTNWSLIDIRRNPFYEGTTRMAYVCFAFVLEVNRWRIVSPPNGHHDTV